MSKEFSTFADGSDCKECAALERKIATLTARLAAAEARHEADAKLLAEHAKTIKHYREKYEQEKEDRQKAEARQYSVGAEHLREYAARVRERDVAWEIADNYRTELLCLAVTNPCGHLGRFMEQGAGCAKCKLAAAEQRLAAAEASREAYRKAGASLLQAFQGRFSIAADDMEDCLKTVDMEVEIMMSKTNGGEP